MVQIGRNGKKPPPPLPNPQAIPATATIYELFWFARIIYINRELETAHVQWFWHSSTTAMQELFDPRELFLAELCDAIDLHCVVGKATVQYFYPKEDPELKLKHGDFFYK
jgi:DNA (cytosine-5)-methyltransferase 1